jgi:hypothetical protein
MLIEICEEWDSFFPWNYRKAIFKIVAGVPVIILAQGKNKNSFCIFLGKKLGFGLTKEKNIKNKKQIFRLDHE